LDCLIALAKLHSVLCFATKQNQHIHAVARPGFDLGGVDFVNMGGKKSLKMLTVEVKSHL